VTVTDSRGCTATGTGTATESCPNGCTPGFWCGGVGSKMWNTDNDPQWPGPSASCGGHNPFKQSDLFTSFFASAPTVVGKTMSDLLCTGGGSDPAQKAARDVIAACLNGCSGIGYPYTCDQIKTLWQGALDGTGQYNLDQLHVLLAAANQGGCPFGATSSLTTEDPGTTDGSPAVTQSGPAPAVPGSELDGLQLYRPMPNPFANSTRVVYAVPAGGGKVDIGVFDLAGRRIRSLATGVIGAGRHTATWDGLNEDGLRVKNGMYFIHTAIAGQHRTISVVLLK
jgi:flagellar hook capping protein FlgD